MMGPHHAVCGAAAWLAIATKPVIDLSDGMTVDEFVATPKSWFDSWNS